MPAWVAMMISIRPFSPAAASVFMSPSSTAWNGWVVSHSGCSGASALTRSSAKASWVYIGCSTHSVPSLSNTAMRSGSGTKSGEPSLVTFSTKATMAAFGAVSFQDGRGSVWASPRATMQAGPMQPSAIAKPLRRLRRSKHSAPPQRVLPLRSAGCYRIFPGSLPRAHGLCAGPSAGLHGAARLTRGRTPL